MDTRVRKLLNDKGFSERDLPNHASGVSLCRASDCFAGVAASHCCTMCSIVSLAPAPALFRDTVALFRDFVAAKPPACVLRAEHWV
jgi:hypothetical protein